jgi:hypothetical protein
VSLITLSGGPGWRRREAGEKRVTPMRRSDRTGARRIGARTLAPTPGKELEPASMSCAARTELNTIAERDNIFAGLPFGLVKNDQTGF